MIDRSKVGFFKIHNKIIFRDKNRIIRHCLRMLFHNIELIDYRIDINYVRIYCYCDFFEKISQILTNLCDFPEYDIIFDTTGKLTKIKAVKINEEYLKKVNELLPIGDNEI